MENKLFRESAMKKISSPEQLNEYIKVTNPGVWAALLAVIILLVGVCVWGVMGKLETTVDAVAVIDGENPVCYLTDAEAVSRIAEGRQVKIGDYVYTVRTVSQSLSVKDCSLLTGSERAKSLLGGISDDDRVYEISLTPPSESAAESGVYSAKIVIEIISPMSFIFN